MKKSTELIEFFIKIAILAAAEYATGIVSEGEEIPFETINLDEMTGCLT